MNTYATAYKHNIKKVHERKKHFQCKICGDATSDKHILNKHIQTVHEEKKPYLYLFFEYAIPNIEYATDEKTHLAKHVQAVNEGEELSKTSFNVKFVMTLLLTNTILSSISRLYMKKRLLSTILTA